MKCLFCKDSPGHRAGCPEGVTGVIVELSLMKLWLEGFDHRIVGKPAKHPDDPSYMLGWNAGQTSSQDEGGVATQIPK